MPHRVKRLALISLLALTLGLSGALPAAAADHPLLQKSGLARLLQNQLNKLTRSQTLAVNSPSLGPIAVRSTLNPRLQSWAQNRVRHLKSERSAVVILEPDSGRVLALAGARRGRLDPGVALRAEAPAASLFKVVTAVAVLEETSLTPLTRLGYVGRPHTLYRYQLRPKPRRRPHWVTLAHSFATSNNVIFARLGIFRLGEDILMRYSRALGFERPMAFELPVQVSHLADPRNKFQLAQLACGYHRATTISPLHAAMLSAVVVNGGLMMEPYLVEEAVASGQRVVYQGGPRPMGFAMSYHTSQQMRRLFEATVKKGTARQAFRRLHRDRILRGLKLGAKTGTLRNIDRTELAEWFTGYGQDPVSRRAIAVCTMVVHGRIKYGSPRKLARLALREAFRLTKTKPPHRLAKGSLNDSRM